MAELERERDAVVDTEPPDRASKTIQQLISLRGIGAQSATVLVREAFVRRFANGKALGSYAGLTSSPYRGCGIDREQGIGKGLLLRFAGSANGLDQLGGASATP